MLQTVSQRVSTNAYKGLSCDIKGLLRNDNYLSELFHCLVTVLSVMHNHETHHEIEMEFLFYNAISFSESSEF